MSPVPSSYHAAMRPKELRLVNLRRLVEEAGSVAALASKCGPSQKYLEQVLGGVVQRNSPRGLGDDVVQRLEKGMGKPPGWMDQFHEDLLRPEYQQLIDSIRVGAVSGALSAEQAMALYHVVKATLKR